MSSHKRWRPHSFSPTGCVELVGCLGLNRLVPGAAAWSPMFSGQLATDATDNNWAGNKVVKCLGLDLIVLDVLVRFETRYWVSRLEHWQGICPLTGDLLWDRCFSNGSREAMTCYDQRNQFQTLNTYTCHWFLCWIFVALKQPSQLEDSLDEDDRSGLPTGTNDAPVVSFESPHENGQAGRAWDKVPCHILPYHAISCNNIWKILEKAFIFKGRDMLLPGIKTWEHIFVRSWQSTSSIKHNLRVYPRVRSSGIIRAGRDNARWIHTQWHGGTTFDQIFESESQNSSSDAFGHFFTRLVKIFEQCDVSWLSKGDGKWMMTDWPTFGVRAPRSPRVLQLVSWLPWARMEAVGNS